MDTLVIHNISLPPRQFGGGHVDELFTNCLKPEGHPYFAEVCHLKVSAHVLINRSGDLTQYVAFDQRAWHAGLSSYSGRDKFNDFSIGIELEGADDIAFEPVQYLVVAKLIAALCNVYPGLTENPWLAEGRIGKELTKEANDTLNIVGHSTISPGRKTDPGPLFDWQKLHQLVRFTAKL